VPAIFTARAWLKLGHDDDDGHHGRGRRGGRYSYQARTCVNSAMMNERKLGRRAPMHYTYGQSYSCTLTATPYFTVTVFAQFSPRARSRCPERSVTVTQRKALPQLSAILLQVAVLSLLLN
jgi:hypothetical protein